eukprot:m.200116 g.200116  ORF g.200116 m.200116 type:complete len:90 (+) comp25196_c1_seq2:1435-1704(+)
MGGRRAAMVLAKGRPPKGIKKAKEVTRVTCQEELTALMACWSANSFDESKCESRMAAFQACINRPPKEGFKSKTKHLTSSELASLHSAK